MQAIQVQRPPLRALQVAFERAFALRTLKYKPMRGLSLFQVATVSLILPPRANTLHV